MNGTTGRGRAAVVVVALLAVLAPTVGAVGSVAAVTDAGTASATTTTNDQYEPNDDTDEAPTLSSGTYTGLTAEADGVDIYAVEVEEGQEVSAAISYDESVAQPTLEVGYEFEGSFTTLAEARNVNGTASVGLESADGQGRYRAGETIYVAVSGGDETVDYDLTIDVGENGTAGLTDAFEPNDEPSTASLVGSGTYTDLTAGPDDVDYYAVEAEEGQEVSAAISYDETVARPTLEIVDSGADTVASAENVGGTASVGYEASDRQTYYIAVSGGDATVDYDLAIDVGENGTAGFADRFEPNDEPSTASLVGSGTYTGLLATRGETDYFGVDLRRGEELSAHISYDEIEGTPRLAVYDREGNRVRAVENPDGSDSIGLRAESTGTYYVGITGGDADVRYDLTIDASESGTAGVGDAFEPNDHRDTASTVEAGRITAVAEDGDRDYYAVPVESGSVLGARLQYDETRGSVGLAVVDDQGETVATLPAGETTGDDIRNVSVESGGTYYVQVIGTQADVNYSLTVSTGEPIDPTTPTATPTATPEPGDDSDGGGSGDGSESEDADDGGTDDGDSESEDADDGETETSSGSGPGFGVTILVTALLVFALLARRQ